MTPTDAKDRQRLRGVQRRRRARATHRRGVLMLVVLSMLVLFLLIGTTFLITSNQYRTASRIVEKANRTTFQPEDVLERALMQALRDTNNRHSAVRYHSLLRDYYGTDGFVASLYAPPGLSIVDTVVAWLPRYAGATTADPLGPTSGQLVDLYVRDDRRGGILSDANAVDLELDENGLPIEYGLSRTDDYYNGCLLTLLDGPCRGDSVRVVDYTVIGVETLLDTDSNPVVVVTGRFRVMAPRRVDGRPLGFFPGSDVLVDFVEGFDLDAPPDGQIDLDELRGRRFMINGRPLNGTGVGLNAFAGPSASRLTSIERVADASGTLLLGLETALVPNSTYFRRGAVAHLRAQAGGDPFALGLIEQNFFYLNNIAFGGADRDTPLYPAFVGPGGADESYDAADFQNLFLASQSPQPRVRGRVVLPDNAGLSANGLLSADPEGYYAADPAAAAPVRLDLEDVPIPSFHRPALMNFWLHRLYRRVVGDGADPQESALAVLLPYGPDFQRNTADDPPGSLPLRDLIVDIKRRAQLRPLREDHPAFDGSNPLSRYDGSTTALGAAITQAPLVNNRGTPNAADDEITFPFWEAVGPWDVDNDRDGAPDSVWVDLGLPVQKTEDGRLYKPLVAFLIEDLDGRLNLNAHGSEEHFVDAPLDATTPSAGGVGNLAQDYNAASPLFSSNQLPHGSGWGPADVTLRPVLSPDLPLSDFINGTSLTSLAQYDDYARALVGRPDPAVDGRNVSPAVRTSITSGRYGSFPASGRNAGDPQFYSPGRSFNTTTPANVINSREERVPFDFAGHPEFAGDPFRLSGFGERPDLFARYGIGVSPTGSAVREAAIDFYASPAQPILDDNPYELDLSADARRRSAADLNAVVSSYGTPNPLNDDAPFSPAELERLLRAFDADADELPGRLWDIVDAFDPEKLAVQNAIAAGVIANPDNFPNYRPNSLEAVNAQAQAAINRRQVTTESFDPPVPNENWTSRLILGADGLPGVPFADDDGDTNADEGDEAVAAYTPPAIPGDPEFHTFNPTGDPNDAFTTDYATLWNNGCDDYAVVMLSNPPPNARITDYLRYRIVLQLAREGIITLYGGPRTEPAVIDQLVNQILFGDNAIATNEVRDDNVVGPLVLPAALPADLYSFGGLLAPEVLAGLKMNLNRPFGDGRDNNGNGVVDEPQEAGEPFVDLNGNGDWDGGEPFQDLDGDGRFYADTNDDGAVNNADWRDFDGDGNFEPVFDSLWPTVAGGPYPLDYARGADANGRGSFVDTNGDGVFQPGESRVFDDARMARQLYARHLYCLMLALVDDGYLAPYDELDPQARHYLDPRSGFLAPAGGGVRLPADGSSTAYRIAFDLGNQTDPSTLSDNELYEARRLAMRKLTCRQIAQWAINCVDIRDPDAIQTPFEYDENPWDGWNVADTVSGQVFPLDGDLATDENDGFVRQIDATGWLSDAADTDGDNDSVERVLRTLPAGARVLATDQTRGVVWGAERPELLMTEGLALHDRRLSDADLANAEGQLNGNQIDDGGTHGSGGAGPDDDYDQRVMPQGSAFVELHNPWSADDHRPREFYSRQQTFFSRPTPTTITATYAPDPRGYNLNVPGVALDRLSNGIAVRRDPARFDEPRTPGNPEGKLTRIRANGFRYRGALAGAGVTATPLDPAASPVWRVVCVEEHPDVRNAVANDNPASPSNAAVDNGAAPGPLNPDAGPWVYREADPGTGLTPGANDRLPEAYRVIANQQATAAPPPGSISAETATLPYLQPDPDWPEFDRFARPQANFVDVAATNPQRETPTEDIEVSIFNSTTETNEPAVRARVQLRKPDRYIERAVYFIGPPELDPPGLGTGTGIGGVGRNVRRNTTQPGLLVPDLAYEIRGRQALLDNVKTLITRDLSSGQPTAGGGGGRIPDLTAPPADLVDEASSGIEMWTITGSGGVFAVSGNKFVVTDRFDADDDLGLGIGGSLPGASVTVPDGIAESLPIAPVLPGRYAVVGSAGTMYEYAPRRLNYSDPADLLTLANRYTTLLSRKARDTNALNSGGLLLWERLRRIELIPSPNPDAQQVITRFNGTSRNVDGSLPNFANDNAADPATLRDNGLRSSEVLADASGRFNLTDPLSPVGPFGGTPLIQPAVAVPIDGFSVSEPVDGYYTRRGELLTNDQPSVRVEKTRTNPDNEIVPVSPSNPDQTVGYDQPLDILDELIRDQTTPNYRTLHLQRLANPLLAWNPPPRRPGGQPVPEHDPDRPVNPYLTVDSLPLDLYAYNGSEPPDGPAIDSANARALASTERGVDPGNPFAAAAAFPQPGTVANAQQAATFEAAQRMTPRDLWRAFTHTASTAPGLRYRSNGGVLEPTDPTGTPLDPTGIAPPDIETFENEGGPGAGGSRPPYPFELQHSLGFANRGFGALVTNADLAGNNAATIDLNGDSVARDLVGVPAINQVDDNPTDTDGDGLPNDLASLSNNDPAPALHWPNRPFVSATEVLLTPAWGSSRLLTYFSTFNPYSLGQPDNRRPNAYDGEALFNGGTRVPPNNITGANPEDTNRGRWRNQQEPFGHLLNFFQTASLPSTAVQSAGTDEVIAFGAPHYYRLLDYVHVPSRFIETDTLLNPQVFGGLTPTLDDPRVGLTAPFNRVDHYREPGRVNLNTVGGRRDRDETPSSGPQLPTDAPGAQRPYRPADMWSEVYDGLMHRRQDVGAIDYAGGTLLQLGHLGPAWRDVVISRRGYIQPTYVSFDNTLGLQPTGVDYSPATLHPDFPTLVANPLRAADSGYNVPLPVLQQGGVDTSLLRAHAFSPGEDGAWSARGRGSVFNDGDSPVDKGGDLIADSDFVRDNYDEAGVVLDPRVDRNGDGRSDRDIPSTRLSQAGLPATVPDSLNSSGALTAQSAPTPMFTGASTEPSLNTERNPQLRYSPMTRLANLVTGRSGVFAIWITVGYFEVTPVTEQEHPAIWARYELGVPDNNDPRQLELTDLFFSVYQDGYTLGEEIDLDIGENRRMRGFYIVDRTLPVAFKPGDDVNVENAILLRRRIE